MNDLFSLDDIGLDSAVTLTEANTTTVEEDVYSRLVYLLYTMKVDLPTWIKNKIPFSTSLDKPLVLWSPLLKSAYKKGSAYGEGSLEEIKYCLDKVIQSELKDFEERHNFWVYIQSLAEGLFEENESLPLEAVTEGEDLEKFNSGFTPFDIVTGGFYQGVVTIAGTPGSGKTSLILSFMGELAKQYPVWYFQTEIPGKLIKTRVSYIKPKNCVPGSMLFFGNYSSETILKMVKEDPSSNRIIIYDSPEIKTSGIDSIQYFEKVYQDLVSIKMLSRLVVVTSQTKQGISWEDMGIYSLSDSAAKARYTDVIIYVTRLLDTVLVKTGKNRFGALGQAMTKYDFATLKIQNDYLFDDFEVTNETDDS